MRRTSRGVTVTGRESGPTYGKPCFPGIQKLAIGLNLSVFHLEAGLIFFLNQINSQGVFYLPDWFILFCSDLGQKFLHSAGCGRRWLTGRDDVSGCYSVSGDFSVWLPPFCSSSVSLGYWHGCLFLRRTSEMNIQILNWVLSQWTGGGRQSWKGKGNRNFCLFGDASFVQDRGTFVHTQNKEIWMKLLAPCLPRLWPAWSIVAQGGHPTQSTTFYTTTSHCHPLTGQGLAQNPANCNWAPSLK